MNPNSNTFFFYKEKMKTLSLRTLKIHQIWEEEKAAYRLPVHTHTYAHKYMLYFVGVQMFVAE